MAVRVAEHDGADADARHQGRQRAERAPRLEHGALALLRVGHEVVGDAADVPPRGLDVSPEVQHARPGLGARAREQAEAHVARSRRSRGAPESYRYFVGHMMVRHMCADGLASKTSPSLGCLKVRPTMSVNSSSCTCTPGSKA